MSARLASVPHSVALFGAALITFVMIATSGSVLPIA